MKEKKYILTEETREYLDVTLYRIEAATDFFDVKKGDKGGWIESEKNLSHEGDAWVCGNAKVCGNACVCGNAKVCGNACVGGNAKVCGNACVGGNAEVWGNAKVGGNAKVCGNACVGGNAKVCGNACVGGNAKVCGNAEVWGDACVSGDAKVCGNACVGGNAEVWGNACVSGDASVWGNAKIESYKDYIVFKNWWSSGRYFTWTRSSNMWKVGCFYGTGEELIKKAYADSPESGREYERVVRYVESILKDEDK